MHTITLFLEFNLCKKNKITDMKYKKYIVIVFLAFALVPLLSAKSTALKVEVFDVKSIAFIDETQQIDLGFDTEDYLPKDFNPYAEEFNLNEVNFMEDETIDLGFDAKDFLPKNFNAYLKK